MIGVLEGFNFVSGLFGGGHSADYIAERNSIPMYKAKALAGDADAYAILHCLAGDQEFRAQAYAAGQIGLGPGEACGAADNAGKAEARAAIAEVDLRQKFAVIAGKVTLLSAQLGTSADSGTYTNTVGQGLLDRFGIGKPSTSTIVIGVLVVGVVLFLVWKRR